jgi:LuxR family maltose regulon positive regulatory protein
MLWMETPHLTQAHILIARNHGSDLRVALEILDAVSDVAERTHNTTHKLRVLALRALALEMMGEREGAQIALQQAVELARPGGFVRVFVELGPPMKAMLEQLSNESFAAEIIRRVLQAFPDADSGPPSVAPAASVERSPDRGNGSLVEPLTARELEILELLRRRSSDKEIARALIISPATVQRHTANIYGKLGVHRRSDAVAVAEDLGLLPPH